MLLYLINRNDDILSSSQMLDKFLRIKFAYSGLELKSSLDRYSAYELTNWRKERGYGMTTVSDGLSAAYVWRQKATL